MAGNELREGIDHRNDRLAEVAVLHAGGSPEGAGAGHVAAIGWKCGNDIGVRRTPVQSRVHGGNNYNRPILAELCPMLLHPPVRPVAFSLGPLPCAGTA